METLDSQIQYYEEKLSKIPDEYNTSMLCEWSAIREKELYFRREIYRLNNIKKDRELKNKYFKTPVGYQKMGYPKQRSKNCLDPKNRTNGMNKRGLDRNLRFARDPIAEPQRKQTILRLARDRLAEAPSSRPPRPGPRKKCRFSDSREAGSAPAPWPPLQTKLL